MSPTVFISYRRDDEAAFAGRIYDRLAAKLTSEQVFMDVDSIPPGVDFVAHLQGWIDRSDVVLAMIGPGWLRARTGWMGRRRLDDPEDFVRIELERALASDKRVIPVLMAGAAMPRTRDLPDSLRLLTRRNAVAVSHGRFGSDTEGLIRAIQSAPETAAAQAAPKAGGPVPAVEETRQERLQARLEQTQDLSDTLGAEDPVGAAKDRLRAVAVEQIAAAQRGEGGTRRPPSSLRQLYSKAPGAVRFLIGALVGWAGFYGVVLAVVALANRNIADLASEAGLDREVGVAITLIAWAVAIIATAIFFARQREDGRQATDTGGNGGVGET